MALPKPGTHKSLRRIVRTGGGQFHAVQAIPGDLNRSGHTYYIVYFHSPATGSTLTMRVAGLRPSAVRRHIRESNAKFGIA